jgi:hypothetical protein
MVFQKNGHTIPKLKLAIKTGTAIISIDTLTHVRLHNYSDPRGYDMEHTLVQRTGEKDDL